MAGHSLDEVLHEHLEDVEVSGWQLVDQAVDLVYSPEQLFLLCGGGRREVNNVVNVYSEFFLS